MGTRPRLLYISPVIPLMTGNGLAMRAGMVLELLSARYDVHLLVAAMYPPFSGRIPKPLSKFCCDVAILPPRPQSPGWFHRRLKFGNVRFNVVHVFRLAAVQFAEPYLRRWLHQPRRCLDLDDIESVTLRRLAALYRRNGNLAAAEREESLATHYEMLEDQAFSRFDRIYVCSSLDRRKLAERTRADVQVLPNGVRLPDLVPARTPGDVFAFLFVGTLGYYPNEDGARYLCSQIVPRLRERLGDCFVVNMVGTGASNSLTEAARVPGVCFIGEVADLASWYADADAVLAPLRAGGGTRIKILEAFGYRKPVVATSIALEGIDAEAELHVLIGDTPEAFTDQCARLVRAPNLGARLARQAFALAREKYSLEPLSRILESIDSNAKLS